MIFISLLVDLLLALGGASAFATPDLDVAQADPGEHRTHGHLPGPPPNNGHGGTSHSHHGQHGHNVGPNNGGNHNFH